MSNDIIRDGPDFPIAVGGVGGSGTRAIANILGQLGYHLGGDLNQERDNLWYTLLFKRRTVLDSSAEQIGQLARIFSSAMSGRPCHDSAAFEKIQELAGEERYGHNAGWLSERSKSLRATLLHEQPHRKWAWKEPNTHVLVERLAEHMPGLHYIHVVRDGFDMAFSSNRNQLGYWADTLFQMTDFDPDQPSTALRYWRLVNERIVRLRENGTLPILEVGFECLCERTTEQVLAIAKFCNIAVSSERAREIGAQSVRTPGSVGRHRERDLTNLDADDCRYARETRARLLRALETDASTEPDAVSGMNEARLHPASAGDPIDRRTLELELERLAPFLHDLELPFGLRTVRSSNVRRPELEETRLQDLIDCVFRPLIEAVGSLSGLSVLEVACNCGGVTIEAARRGAKTVLGTDIVAHYVEQARLIKRALGTGNVEFKVAGIDDSPALGRFDVTICCGLLYHLENPVASMRALIEATDQVLVLDTQVLVGYSGPIWQMNVQPAVTHHDPLASTGLWRAQKVCQFKPSAEAVIQLLFFLGFKKVEAVAIDTDHRTEARRTGALRTFVAVK